MSVKLEVQWPRLNRLAVATTLLLGVSSLVTLGLLFIGHLAGPERQVQTILASEAPGIGWFVLPAVVMGVLWLFSELVLPLWICILGIAGAVVEYGIQSVAHEAISVANESVETVGWIFLGIEGFTVGVILVGGLCALVFWVIFVPPAAKGHRRRRRRLVAPNKVS